MCPVLAYGCNNGSISGSHLNRKMKIMKTEREFYDKFMEQLRKPLIRTEHTKEMIFGTKGKGEVKFNVELPEDTVIFDSIEEAFIAMAKEPITVVESDLAMYYKESFDFFIRKEL